MKRLILLLLVFVSLTGNAQSVGPRLSPSVEDRDSVPVPQHMKFMGIPIDGTLTSFTKELKKKGFKHVEAFDSEQIKFFVGNFAGYDNCYIQVIAISPENSRVVAVAVSFPLDEQWSDLASKYNNLKRRLTSKYGEPATCVERFQASAQPDDDFMKMLYVKQDRCEYESNFVNEEGYIVLNIVHANKGGYDFSYVSLVYVDRVNRESMEQDVMDDL